jgi:hypothetical protein
MCLRYFCVRCVPGKTLLNLEVGNQHMNDLIAYSHNVRQAGIADAAEIAALRAYNL